MINLLACILLLSLIDVSLGFLPSCPRIYRRTTAARGKLFGLPEWRNQASNDGKDGKQVLLLPFSCNEALLQGQSTEIVLVHGRFFDLFQDCIDDYESTLGMALMGDDNFLNTMILCEIDDFDVLSGYRGKVTIRVTLRAVARARITKLTQMQPVMMGFCEELVDLECPDLMRANELVNDIEATIIGGRRKQYDAAFENTLKTCSRDEPTADGRRSMSELTAASWAIFAVVSDKCRLQEAISSDQLIDRLQLGLKAILNEKFQLTDIACNSKDIDVTGFE